MILLLAPASAQPRDPNDALVGTWSGTFTCKSGRTWDGPVLMWIVKQPARPSFGFQRSQGVALQGHVAFVGGAHNGNGYYAAGNETSPGEAILRPQGFGLPGLAGIKISVADAGHARATLSDPDCGPVTLLRTATDTTEALDTLKLVPMTMSDLNALPDRLGRLAAEFAVATGPIPPDGAQTVLRTVELAVTRSKLPSIHAGDLIFGIDGHYFKSGMPSRFIGSLSPGSTIHLNIARRSGDGKWTLVTEDVAVTDAAGARILQSVAELRLMTEREAAALPIEGGTFGIAWTGQPVSTLPDGSPLPAPGTLLAVTGTTIDNFTSGDRIFAIEGRSFENADAAAHYIRSLRPAFVARVGLFAAGQSGGPVWRDVRVETAEWLQDELRMHNFVTEMDALRKQLEPTPFHQACSDSGGIYSRRADTFGGGSIEECWR